MYKLLENSAVIRYNKKNNSWKELIMSVISKKAEKVNKVFDNMSDTHYYEEI